MLIPDDKSGGYQSANADPASRCRSVLGQRVHRDLQTADSLAHERTHTRPQLGVVAQLLHENFQLGLNRYIRSPPAQPSSSCGHVAASTAARP